MESTKRCEEIDWLRGFAIFLVVLGHAIIVFPINLHEVPWCEFLFEVISLFHMALFFAISGYCYSMREGYRAYLIKKFKRLMIPYFVFAFGGIIPRLLLPSMVNGVEPIGESITKILFHGGDYWFLYTLFVLFLVFPFVEERIKHSDRILAFACIVVMSIISKYVPNWFCIGSVMWYMPFFCFGYFARENNVFLREKIHPQMYEHKEWSTVIAIVALLFCGYVHGKIDSRIIMLVGAFSGVIVCGLVAFIMPTILKSFERYSKYSL